MLVLAGRQCGSVCVRVITQHHALGACVCCDWAAAMGLRRAQDFRQMVQGLVWPAGVGGVIGQTHSLEVFTKPTVQDYLTDFATGGRIPHPFSSDTKARKPQTLHPRW